MNKYIVKKISPHHTAKMVALAIFTAGVLVILFLASIAVLVLVTNNIGLTMISSWLSRLQLLHIPLSISGLIALLFNSLVGVALTWYLLVALLCNAYNIVARRFGGIKIELIYAPPSQ